MSMGGVIFLSIEKLLYKLRMKVTFLPEQLKNKQLLADVNWDGLASSMSVF
jgi:hypothetical protein